MSMMRCDIHGSWDSDFYESCPRCQEVTIDTPNTTHGLSEADRKAALDAYQDWACQPMDDDGLGDSVAACARRAWIRAWELATQAAYARAAAVCRNYEEEATQQADAALKNGHVLMGHRQLVAEYLEAAILALKYRTSTEGETK